MTLSDETRNETRPQLPGRSTGVPADVRAELGRIVRERAIVSVYQPIVDLQSGLVAGYEALARGPQGSVLEYPDRLFAAAATEGTIDALDAACRAAAFAGARRNAIWGNATLFVNTEPESSAAAMSETYDLLQSTDGGCGVVFEFTERALTLRPATVIEQVRRLRELGAGIALDDVGVDPKSLALLPFVRPDVVKLDLSVIQGARTAHAARVMHAVGAYAERTGAAIVAEGIETEVHLDVARSLGATHGQGWLFGRPTAEPATPHASAPLGPWLTPPSAGKAATPFEQAVAAGRPVQIADKALILKLSQQLERHAATLGDDAVVLGNLQHVRFLTPRTARRYAHLALEAALVGLIGHGVDHRPARGVRGGTFDATDPLALEWSVIVTSPHFSAAMLARDLEDHGPDADRRFSYCLTYDRDLVARAASSLMESLASR